MNNSNYDLSHVEHLIKVLNSGIDFYGEAKSKLDNHELIRIFDQNLTEKHKAVTELQNYVMADKGEPEQDSALSVELRTAYTKVLALVSSDTEHTYISQLEEVEDKVLEAIDKSLKNVMPPQLKETLLRIQIRMQVCHDDMKHLQEVTA